MGKGRLAALLLAAALMAAAGGCTQPSDPLAVTPPAVSAAPTPSPETAEPMDFVLPCYPQSGFHPISGANRTNLTLAGLMYEGLFAVDERFEAQPVLCTGSAVGEDGLTWTFTLDGTARFSDGSALTAADVVYSLNLARQSALYAGRLAGIASVTAGEGTVSVRLSSPNGALPLLLDIPVVRESGDPARPLGTGPYVLEGEGENLSLRNWRGDMPLDSIPLLGVSEAGDLIHAFETRDISLVSTDVTSSNALGFSGSFETQDYATSVMLYVGFNTSGGLCRDEGLRLALQRAFDRSALTTVQISRHATPACLPVSPVSGLYDNTQAQALEYNPEQVRSDLDALGWTAGEDGVRAKGRQSLSLDFVVNSDSTGHLAAAEALAANLTDAGVGVNLRKLSWEEYLSTLEKGDFDLYLGETRMTADFDLTPFLTAGGALNYGGYADAQAGQLLASFRAASGSARGTYARSLYAYLAQHPAFVPLCFKHWSLLTQWGQVEGATPTQQNVFYGFADWKIETQ